jgi:protoheme IX farnesyltransferase
MNSESIQFEEELLPPGAGADGGVSEAHGASASGSPLTFSRSQPRTRAGDYYELTKPRMNFLVVITTMAGYYLASRGRFGWIHLLHTMLGTFLTASSAGTMNQVIERRFDALMPRTKNRPLPAKRIKPIEAALFGIAIGVSGVAYLAILVNPLTAILGATTLLSYLLVYTPMKRRSTLNTVIGAVPGAIPPMMGFTAATGALSPQALCVFGILFFWQMPHFLAIAMMYKDDYKLGGFKMLPCVDESLTARQIVVYALALLPASLLPVPLQMAGSFYFTCAVLLGLTFIAFAISCATTRTRSDARKLFFASILYLPLLLAAMLIDKV